MLLLAHGQSGKVLGCLACVCPAQNCVGAGRAAQAGPDSSLHFFPAASACCSTHVKRLPQKHSLLSATETRSVAFGSAPFHSQTAPECFTGSAREPFVPATKRIRQLGATSALDAGRSLDLSNAESLRQASPPGRKKGFPRHPGTPVGPEVARRKARRKRQKLGPAVRHKASGAIWAPV